jgi:hypothetical protein
VGISSHVVVFVLEVAASRDPVLGGPGRWEAPVIVVIGQEGSGTTMLIEIIRELGVEIHPRREDHGVSSILTTITGPGFRVNRTVPVPQANRTSFAKAMKEYQFDAWKVPRFICFWRDLVEFIPNPVFVVIERKLSAVVRSQVKKLGCSNERATQHVIARRSMVDDFIDNNRCLITHYSGFLADPVWAVQRVSDYIGTDNTNVSKAAALVRKAA